MYLVRLSASWQSHTDSVTARASRAMMSKSKSTWPEFVDDLICVWIFEDCCLSSCSQACKSNFGLSCLNVEIYAQQTRPASELQSIWADTLLHSGNALLQFLCCMPTWKHNICRGCGLSWVINCSSRLSRVPRLIEADMAGQSTYFKLADRDTSDLLFELACYLKGPHVALSFQSCPTTVYLTTAWSTVLQNENEVACRDHLGLLKQNKAVSAAEMFRPTHLLWTFISRSVWPQLLQDWSDSQKGAIETLASIRTSPSPRLKALGLQST